MCQSGGMVDTVDSKSTASNSVRVQVSSLVSFYILSVI